MLQRLFCGLIGFLLLSSTVLAKQSADDVLSAVWPDRPEHPVFDDAVGADSANAAGRYLWLFQRADTKLLDLAGWVDGDKLAFEFHADAEAPGTVDDLRRMLIAQQEWIESIIQAAKMERFDLKYTLGYEPRSPEGDVRGGVLGNARKASRVLRADAVRLWVDGKHDAAAERLVAMFGLAEQFARLPSPMINQLVARSLFGYAHPTARLMLEDQQQFPESKRRDIARILDRVKQDDPTNRRAGWHEYRADALGFVESQLKNGEVGAPLLAVLAQHKGIEIAVGSLFRGVASDPGGSKNKIDPKAKRAAEEAAEELAGLTHAELSKRLETIKKQMAELDRVWEHDDAMERIRAIDTQIHEDETGLPNVVLAFPRQVYRDWNESVKWMTEIRESLKSP